MIGVYKILNGRYDQDAEMQLPVNNNNTRRHQKKLNKEQSKTKIRQSQFRLRVADTWNSLPEYVVEAPSIKSLERRLDTFWADQPIRFYPGPQIITTCIREKLNRMSEDSDLDIEVT